MDYSSYNLELLSNMKNKISRVIDPLNVSLYAPTEDAPFRCVAYSYAANTTVEIHQHSWAQIVFCTQGAVRIYIDNNIYVLPPWKAVWIPSYMYHSADLLEPSNLHSIYIKTEDTETSEWSCNLLIEGFPKGKIFQVSILLNELIKLLASEGIKTSTKYEAIVSLIMFEIQNVPAVKMGISFPTNPDKRILKVCEFFLENPRIDINLSDLIDLIGASPSTIHRLFNKEIGCSFSKWRHQVLLAQAILLAEKNYSITQIAEELGYGSLSAFSHMISQTVGTAPSKFFKDICNLNSI